MDSIWEALRRFWFPEVSEEMERKIDQANLKNMRNISIVGLCCESVALFFTLIEWFFFPQSDTVTGLVSVGICILLCLFGILFTGRAKQSRLSHKAILAVSLVFCALLVVWAVSASYRHYVAETQMLTFFTVSFVISCFLSFRPMHSLFLTVLGYGGLYLLIWAYDHGSRVTAINYFIFATLTFIGMLLRYSRQQEEARAQEELSYRSRHDELTGFRDRLAFREDLAGYVNVPLVAIMTDIDFFKQINDTYGHLLGDKVIGESGKYLHKLIPDGIFYRYGGDEYLILIKDSSLDALSRILSRRDGFSFLLDEEGLEVHLSFGASCGLASTTEEVMSIISDADVRLYEAKERIHKNDVHTI